MLRNLRVLLLEDKADRVAAMGDALAEIAEDVTIRLSDNAPQFIDALAGELPSADLVSLDHDLGPSRLVGGHMIDPGDGRDVAAALALCPPRCPVIIHSTNAPAAYNMGETLRAANWRVSAIMPYGDLAWVREGWLPLVLQSLIAWKR
jgi:hypothetical protein